MFKRLMQPLLESWPAILLGVYLSYIGLSPDTPHFWVILFLTGLTVVYAGDKTLSDKDDPKELKDQDEQGKN